MANIQTQITRYKEINDAITKEEHEFSKKLESAKKQRCETYNSIANTTQNFFKKIIKEVKTYTNYNSKLPPFKVAAKLGIKGESDSAIYIGYISIDSTITGISQIDENKIVFLANDNSPSNFTMGTLEVPLSFYEHDFNDLQFIRDICDEITEENKSKPAYEQGY